MIFDRNGFVWNDLSRVKTAYESVGKGSDILYQALESPEKELHELAGAAKQKLVQ